MLTISPGGNLLALLRNIGRVFRRYPVMAVLAVVVLGIGLGACFTVYSLFINLLSVRVPGVNGGPFLSMGIEQLSGPLGGMKWSDFETVRTSSSSSLHITASSFPTSVRVQARDTNEQINAELVASSYFETLGVRLEAGRDIERADEANSNPKVAIIRSDYARRWFGQPSHALGQTILLNQQQLRIVGVAAPPFSGALNSQIALWAPPVAFTPVFFQPPSAKPGAGSSAAPAIPDLGAALWRNTEIYYALARSDNQSHLTQTQLSTLVSASTHGVVSRLQIVPGIDNDPNHRATLTSWGKLALGLSATLFIVAALNFSAFFIAQIPGRLDEMRIRRNLGAQSHHLAAELLRAPLVLLMFSTAFAVVISFNGKNLLLKLPPFSMADVTLNAPVPSYGIVGSSPVNWSTIGMLVLLFLIGLAVAGGLPIIELFRVEKRALGSHVTSGGGAKRILLTVIACQAALALGSVLSASFTIKYLYDQEHAYPGFNPTHVTVVKMSRGAGDQVPELLVDPSGEFPLAVFSGLALRRLAKMPGVDFSAVASAVPLSGSPGSLQIVQPNGDNVTAACNAVTSGYFAAMGIRLLKGRTFSTESLAGTPAEAVVNMRLAKMLWPDETALGKTVRAIFQGGPIGIQVVGIADDAHYEGLNHTAAPLIYLPAAGTAFPAFPVFVVRGSAYEAAVADVVRDSFGHNIPGLTVTESFALRDLYTQTFQNERLRTALGIGAGCMLLLLAIIGVYGITMFRTAVRRRELAIRMCMGAGTGSVLWTVLRELLFVMIVAFGITVIAWNAWDKVLQQQMRGVNLWNLQLWILGVVLWSMAILSAAVVPAIKIRTIRPAELLKAE